MSAMIFQTKLLFANKHGHFFGFVFKFNWIGIAINPHQNINTLAWIACGWIFQPNFLNRSHNVLGIETMSVLNELKAKPIEGVESTMQWQRSPGAVHYLSFLGSGGSFVTNAVSLTNEQGGTNNRGVCPTSIQGVRPFMVIRGN